MKGYTIKSCYPASFSNAFLFDRDPLLKKGICSLSLCLATSGIDGWMTFNGFTALLTKQSSHVKIMEGCVQWVPGQQRERSQFLTL